MSHLEYLEFQLERKLNQWAIWDEEMQDYTYLPLSVVTIEDLKTYLDDLKKREL